MDCMPHKWKNGKYEFLRNLQRDRTGYYILVKDTESDKDYALKSYNLSDDDSERIARVESDAQLINGLNCANILKFVESFAEDSNYIIVTEHCPEGDLRTVIEHHRAFGKELGETQVLEWTAQMCHALHELHERTIVHYDLNPESVFVSNGQLKLGGLAAFVSMQSFKLGTVSISGYAYASPEVIQNREITSKSNVWSVACIVYELLTLERAFKGPLREVIESIINVDIPEVEKSVFLCPILNKMFQKRPDMRPSSKRIHNLCKSILERKRSFEKAVIRELIVSETMSDAVKFKKGRYIYDKSLGATKSNKLVVLDIENAYKRVVLNFAANNMLQSEIQNLDREVTKLRELRDKDQENSIYILKLIDQFTELNKFCIVTEYCPHGDLENTIEIYKQKNENPELEMTRRIMTELMCGLTFLHDNDIVHRNLKPSNIFWHLNQIKIGDFDMLTSAKCVNSSIGKFTALNYVAPEMLIAAESAGLSEKIDIWSAGCIVFELVSLKKAFEGQSTLELQNKIRMTEAELNLEHLPNIACYDKIKVVISRMLNKIADKRPSARSIKEQIKTNRVVEVEE